MRQPTGRRARALSACAALLVLVPLASCRTTTDARPAQQPGALVVASFSFPESELLAEIYAQALAAHGVPVRRERALGPRELVGPALQQGFVDVVPEYVGAALAGARPGGQRDVPDVGSARRALDQLLRPWGLRTLEPSAASNENSLAVTRVTARRLGLRAVSDLATAAPTLRFATTPECARRAECLPGLRSVYGLHFARVTTYATPADRAAALDEGSADVALLFSTDPRLAGDDLVQLRDDRQLQPAENVVPVVSRRALTRHGAVVARTLDRVSAALTTGSLRLLNWRIQVAGRSVRAEAHGWLLRHGIVTAPG